jgi:hypothetical protein
VPLKLNNLDSLTRAMMIREIESDAQNQTLYLSTRLSATGIADYLALLREAAEKYDDTWLATQLQLNSRINLTEVRKKTDWWNHGRERADHSSRDARGRRV